VSARGVKERKVIRTLRTRGARLLNWRPEDGSPLDLNPPVNMGPGHILRSVHTPPQMGRRRKKHAGKPRRPVLCWRGCVAIVPLALTPMHTCICLLERWKHPDEASGRNPEASIYRSTNVRKFHATVDTIRFVIDYPIRKDVHVTVDRCRADGEPTQRWSAGYIAWAVAQEYVRIYRAYRKHGVWGHVLGDLWLEGMDVYADGYVDLWIGS